MTIEAITNGIVIAGVVVVSAVITGGALIGRQPSGCLTGTATRFELLSGWRLLAVALMGWLLGAKRPGRLQGLVQVALQHGSLTRLDTHLPRG